MVDKTDLLSIQSISSKNVSTNTEIHRSRTPTGVGFFMPKILNIYIEDITMIKGLAITPPVLGRISIGKIVENDDYKSYLEEAAKYTVVE